MTQSHPFHTMPPADLEPLNPDQVYVYHDGTETTLDRLIADALDIYEIEDWEILEIPGVWQLVARAWIDPACEHYQAKPREDQP